MILPQTAAGIPEFEQLINGLLENQAGTLPQYLNENLYKGLRANLEKLLAAGKESSNPKGSGGGCAWPSQQSSRPVRFNSQMGTS